MSYILRRQDKTKYYQNYYDWYRDTYHLPNVQVIGYPTFNNQYVFGGFSTTNYLLTHNTVDLNQCNNFELCVKGTYGTGSMVQIHSNNPYVIAMHPGMFLIRLTGNTGWTTIYNNNTDLVSGKTYWMKCIWTGSQYNFQRSEDGINYTVLGTLDSSVKPISNLNQFIFGINDVHTDPYLGTIDISQSYIKINGEYWWKGVATSTPAPTFVQPNLTTYGNLSTDQFACAFSSVHSTAYEGWRLFNTTSTGNGNCWATNAQPTEESPQVVVWGGVNYMNVKNIQIVNRTGTANYCTAPSAGYVQVSNDNVNWITLKSFTNSNNNWGESWDISLADNNYYYKYYRLYITASHETTINYMCIQQINLTATVYTTRENVLVESNTRNCSKQYTGKMLLNKVQTTSDDYDVSKIEKREYVIKTDNKEYTLRIK